MAKVEFRPTLKSMNVANDKVKIVLEIPKDKIVNNLGSLAMLEGGKITASFRPETIPYTIPYDKTNNTPTIRYEESTDGEWEVIKEEQTNLMGEDDIEKRNFIVELDVVDEFIKTVQLDYPGEINPDDVLNRLAQGSSIDEIAADYEMFADDVEEELNRARSYYAPYAAAWDEKRNREA
ncbi:hypothetical protein [Enterococcus sp. DIV0180]|uniref:hypothetical protein n=1 Tax=Enterococcus sp. DIV0180 TaxID=2774749 RepID=UPI003D2F9C43